MNHLPSLQPYQVARKPDGEYITAFQDNGGGFFKPGGVNTLVTSGTVLQSDSAGRPNFAGLIYGAPFGAMPRIPGHLPPLFMAWAQDDQIARDFAARFYDALVKSGQRPEAHIYSAGGHGFGLKKQGTTSDHWIDDFYNWLDGQGLVKRREL